MMAWYIDGKVFDPNDKATDSADLAAAKLPLGCMKINDWVVLARAVRVAATLPDPLFVEIGIDKAQTTHNILTVLDADNLPAVRYIGIDPCEDPMIFWRGRIAIAKWRHATEFRYATSIAVAPEVADGSVALVLIDGCHCTQCVEDDIRAWYPKVRTGGFAAHHDDNPAIVGYKMGRGYSHRKRGHGVATAIEKTKDIREALGFTQWGQSRTDPTPPKNRPKSWMTIFRKV